MTTFVQLHLLTAYPPANLNRDDTGQPKTAQFGGVQRLRISSQALKRTWRVSPEFRDALAGHLASRTQRLGAMIRDHLAGGGVDDDRAVAIAREVAGLFGKIKPEKDDNPVYIAQLAFISAEEQAAALALAERLAAGEAAEVKAEAVLRATDGAVDIAMFGRMLADDPAFNREAAVQVAHAISTHRVMIEDDFYTAVDDLKRPAEDAGAGFVGEAGFAAGLFYLYLCVDRDLLVRNLGGDEVLARAGIAALVAAAAKVAPRGKQASFASRARASYILAERGAAAPRTLAAAFLKPVADDIQKNSINALEAARADFARAYGDEGGESALMDVPGRRGSLADIVALAAG